MNFIRHCVRRRVAMLMAVLCVLVFGFVSITGTPIRAPAIPISAPMLPPMKTDVLPSAITHHPKAKFTSEL